MAEEEQVMARPASHPIVTGLLVTSSVALGLNIYLVSQELFSFYLTTNVAAGTASPIAMAKKDKPVHDYFKAEFGSKSIDDDLALDSTGSPGGGGGPPPGGGGAPPPKDPPPKDTPPADGE